MIGVFDSGLGGLSALKELRRRFPSLDTVYLADTARLPYGAHTKAAVLRYAREALGFFESMGADTILFACGTVSALALDTLKKESALALYGIISPAVEAAKSLAHTQKIALLGTEATVKSGVFAAALKEALPSASLVSVACPLFVSLAEEGLFDPENPVTVATVFHYLSPLLQESPDAILLGCTHFSLLAPCIRRLFPHTTLLDCGALAAKAVLPKEEGEGRLRFFVTENAARFAEKASRILGEAITATPLSLSSFA